MKPSTRDQILQASIPSQTPLTTLGWAVDHLGAAVVSLSRTSDDGFSERGTTHLREQVGKAVGEIATAAVRAGAFSDLGSVVDAMSMRRDRAARFAESLDDRELGATSKTAIVARALSAAVMETGKAIAALAGGETGEPELSAAIERSIEVLDLV